MLGFSVSIPYALKTEQWELKFARMAPTDPPSHHCDHQDSVPLEQLWREQRPQEKQGLELQRIWNNRTETSLRPFLVSYIISASAQSTWPRNALKIIAYWQSINSNKWDRPHTCYEIKYQDFNLEGVSKKQNTTLIEIDFPWFSLWGCLFYDSLFFIFLFSVQQVVSTGDGLNQSSVGVQRTGPQLGG